MENLLLLHGALGSAATLVPLQQALQNKYKVYTLDFTGHGGLPLPQEPYSMEHFAQDIKTFLDKNGIEQTHIFGYSMGGYVALYFALQHPTRVSSIFTLATKFAWSPEIAEKECKMLDPEKIEQKVPQFAQTLANRHSPQDWKVVMHKTADMMRNLGDAPALTTESLQQLSAPVQFSVGDSDNMVSTAETIWAHKQVYNSSLLVIPNTRHPLEAVSVDRLTFEITAFTGAVTRKPAFI